MNRIKKLGAAVVHLIKQIWGKIRNVKKRWLALVMIPLVLLLSFGGWRVWHNKAIEASKMSSAQRTTAVIKGNMEITLSGSGAIAADSRSELTTEVAGKVLENNMTEGKAVKAGDVLLTLASDEAELSLKKMENSVEQKEQAYLKQQNQVSNLNLKAPFSGTVTGISYESGDNINSGATLLTISDESSLTAKVQFANASAENLNGVSSVQLHIPEYATTLSAKIDKIHQLGNDLEVTLTLKNPGALKAGTSVWAEAATAAGTLSSDQVPLAWANQQIIKADSTGTVEKVYISENQKVTAGTLLMTITNNDLALELENSRLQLEQANYDLEQTQLDLNKYQIVAPFDGNIISVENIAVGDNLKAGTKVAVLIDTNKFSFSINVDELDISQVKVGQEVSVTVEALEDTSTTPLKGVVSSVALEGTSNNGVTSYPVSIAITGKDGLRSGMNVDGVIQVEKKENVLMVPLEAVQKRGNSYTVWVKREGAVSTESPSQETAAQGYGNRQNRELTPEQQQQMQQFQNMTDEQRQALREQMAAQRGTQGNGTQGDSVQGENRQRGNFGGGNSQGTNNQGASGQGTTPAQEGTAAQGTARTQSGFAGRNAAASSNSYYEGAVQVRVEVGIHNDSYMEIISGLNEGEEVVLPEITASSTTSSQGQNTGIESSLRGLGGGSVMPTMPSGGGNFNRNSGSGGGQR